MDNDIVITFCDSVLVIKIPTTWHPGLKTKTLLKTIFQHFKFNNVKRPNFINLKCF
jgi:hypothetical protein